MSTETDLPRLTIRDPQVMRALAHPARLAIMDHLMTGTSATATECAQVCGLSPSAMSYHLRALAKAGLVEDAPSRGDARERVWRATTQGFNVDSDSSDPETRAAEHDLVTVLLHRQDEQLRRWLDKVPDEPQEWQQASAISEAKLVMTVDELNELNQTIIDLAKPYSVRRRHDPPPGSRPVSLVFRTYPTD